MTRVYISPLSVYLLFLSGLKCQSRRAGDTDRNFKALLFSDGDLKTALCLACVRLGGFIVACLC